MSSKTDLRRPASTTIRLADYETKFARVSWRESQIQRPEIRLPRVELEGAPPRDRVER